MVGVFVVACDVLVGRYSAAGWFLRKAVYYYQLDSVGRQLAFAIVGGFVLSDWCFLLFARGETDVF